jgi:hypothetical protein
MHPGFLCLCKPLPPLPEEAVISLFFRSLRRGRPGFLRRRSDPSLIIPCKNSKNSEAALSGGPVRKGMCIP